MMTTENRRESTSLSQAIVTAVAEEEGVEPTELPPLFRVIDTDALDVLFTPRGREKPQTEGRVVFHYLGYEVTVDSAGRVKLDESVEIPEK